MVERQERLEIFDRIKSFVGSQHVSVKTFRIVPIPKPRMTQRDKWAGRPCVLAYWAFRDEIRKQQKTFQLPRGQFWILYCLPMPDTWKEEKKLAFEFQPHQQKPDKDNLDKALFDALLCEEKINKRGKAKIAISDQSIWDSASTKVWSRNPEIRIYYKRRD